MNEETKNEIISFVQTFISSVLTVLGSLILTVDPKILTDFSAWSFATILSVFLGVVRVALKTTWQKTMPLSLGGKV